MTLSAYLISHALENLLVSHHWRSDRGGLPLKSAYGSQVQKAACVTALLLQSMST